MNWNVIYAHAWPDTLYTDMVLFLNNGGVFTRPLPDHIKKTFRRRARTGYAVKPQNPDQIVLSVQTTPWNQVNNRILVDNGAPRGFTFKVVKASDRVDVLRRFMTDMRNVGTNAHMLVDRLHRQGYLGISRRFVHHFLRSDPSTLALRVQTQPNTRTVIKSFRPSYPFEHWQMDLMNMTGPNNTWIYKNKRYAYVFVIIDIFTKFVYIYPLKNKEGITIAMILNKLFLSGDIPDKLHSDKGGEFVNGYVSKLCLDFKVKQIVGQAYSPQTQGFVENKNKQIKRLLKYYMINNDNNMYYDVLDQVAYTINNSKHGVTGFTPMQLHRGRQTERNFSVTENNEENVENTFQTLFEEPADADLENYYSRQTAVYNARVHHVKNTLKGVASKRENTQRAKKRPMKKDTLVHVMTHVIDGTDMMGVFIRVGPNQLIDNPIKATFEGTFRPIPDMKKYPLSLFTSADLSGRSKFYKPLFRIDRIVDDTLAAVRYHLVTDEENPQPVYIKTTNGGRYVRHFYKDNLVLFDLQTARDQVRLAKINPNPLFVDLHNRRPQPPQQAEQQQPQQAEQQQQEEVAQEVEVVRETNSIESLLLENVLLTEKPYIFINMVKAGDEKVPFIYIAQIVGKSNTKFTLRLGTPDSVTLALIPKHYNAMNTKHGWRFVEHNRWLIRPDCRRAPKIQDGPHYVTNEKDVPLVDYKDLLNDPSYTIRELANHDIEQNPNLLIRYKNQTAALVHKKHRKSTKQTSQSQDKWEIQFVNGGESQAVSLTPGTYGKDWEFMNFNFVFNIQLKEAIKSFRI
jgi:transposase InsO family protein